MLLQGKDDRKAAAGQAFLVFALGIHPDTAVMRRNNSSRNRQAQPWPRPAKLRIAGRMELDIANAKELLKNQLMELGINANAGISDGNLDKGLAALPRYQRPCDHNLTII